MLFTQKNTDTGTSCSTESMAMLCHRSRKLASRFIPPENNTLKFSPEIELIGEQEFYHATREAFLKRYDIPAGGFQRNLKRERSTFLGRHWHKFWRDVHLLERPVLSSPEEYKLIILKDELPKIKPGEQERLFFLELLRGGLEREYEDFHHSLKKAMRRFLARHTRFTSMSDRGESELEEKTLFHTDLDEYQSRLGWHEAYIWGCFHLCEKAKLFSLKARISDYGPPDRLRLGIVHEYVYPKGTYLWRARAVVQKIFERNLNELFELSFQNPVLLSFLVGNTDVFFVNENLSPSTRNNLTKLQSLCWFKGNKIVSGADPWSKSDLDPSLLDQVGTIFQASESE